MSSWVVFHDLLLLILELKIFMLQVAAVESK